MIDLDKYEEILRDSIDRGMEITPHQTAEILDIVIRLKRANSDIERLRNDNRSLANSIGFEI